MKKAADVISQWARLGILFDAAPSKREVDLEWLLLETARQLPHNARLLGTVATWLALYGNFVARHRLARLVRDELEVEHQAGLGLLIESAAGLGASRDLGAVAKACARARPARPLFAVQTELRLEDLAERHASALSRRWGVWAPEVELRLKTIRPVTWVLERNPSYRERIVRKGDLRVSIIETLRWDVGQRGEGAAGQAGCLHHKGAVSESELARLCGATRVAVRSALKALELEGVVALNDARVNRRENSVRLVA